MWARGACRKDWAVENSVGWKTCPVLDWRACPGLGSHVGQRAAPYLCQYPGCFDVAPTAACIVLAELPWGGGCYHKDRAVGDVPCRGPCTGHGSQGGHKCDSSSLSGDFSAKLLI